MQNQTTAQIKDLISLYLSRYYGVSLQEASDMQIYKSIVMILRGILAEKRQNSKKRMCEQQAKRVYYMCMEFLLGPSVKTCLYNLGLTDQYTKALKEIGRDIEKIYDMEPDPGLGNGGLGRLAACFMDSLASLDYPAFGFSICYEYGLFKQKIVDGNQFELPDAWMKDGDTWLVPRSDKIFSVKFGGKISEDWSSGKLRIIHRDYEEVEALPYDMFISGHSSENVSVLKLWKAQAAHGFDFNLFNKGLYDKAVSENNAAEVISKCLYPADNHNEGKLLRLSQQYFLVSASMQCIINDHLALYNTLNNFHEKVAIHINDTHPALCIAELMRLFMDEYGYSWDYAWRIITKTVSYTNHTVLPEALECWNEDFFKLKLPRIHMIVSEINTRFCKELWDKYTGDWDRISRMSILCNNQVRMANLSVCGSHKVNGVSKLHSDILKADIFNDFYRDTPDKFTNVTNGIAHRRWLCASNPRLCQLISELIGDGYIKNPEELSKLKVFENEETVLQRIGEIKKLNKIDFSNRMARMTGQIFDPDTVYDVQAKRMHEYKRQLLKALQIIDTYATLLENPDADVEPVTFMFAAKAFGGYYVAKEIIRLICSISAEIEKNPKIKEKMRVIFFEDYRVSLAEHLLPSANLSEQISLAGKEASGTGNMKLMINGALTLGTLDGANVEIHEAVGEENIFIFGLNADDVKALWSKGYASKEYYNSNPRIKRVVDMIAKGFNGESFDHISNYLLNAPGVPDPYMCLADFASYVHTFDLAMKKYRDPIAWNRSSLINTASAGRFAADRSINDYAKEIWNISPLK